MAELMHHLFRCTEPGVSVLYFTLLPNELLEMLIKYGCFAPGIEITPPLRLKSRDQTFWEFIPRKPYDRFVDRWIFDVGDCCSSRSYWFNHGMSTFKAVWKYGERCPCGGLWCDKERPLLEADPFVIEWEQPICTLCYQRIPPKNMHYTYMKSDQHDCQEVGDSGVNALRLIYDSKGLLARKGFIDTYRKRKRNSDQ